MDPVVDLASDPGHGIQIPLFGVTIEVPTIDLVDATVLHAAWYLDPDLAVAEASPLPWFWLGCTEPHWLWEGQAQGPLLITARRLHARASTRGRNALRPATVPVFLDSGAFSEIDAHGLWALTAAEYVELVRRFCAALGTVRHVGIQDWMCEPQMVKRTGLSVAEHQRRTVSSYLELRSSAPEIPWVPTLQGYTAAEYFTCAELYQRAGVDLAAAPLVGLGSVCRRSGTDEIEALIAELTRELPGLRLHGFGLKSEGALRSCAGLRSVDSDAWSRRGRGAEVDARAALGLPAKAPAAAMYAVSHDEIDIDMADFLAWRRQHAPGGANNSQAFAEYWRARQHAELAVRAARAALGIKENEP